ncbi:recombinase family protein [Vibrio lentus]|uniref:recombinase family protein n=1 Tax=Vibrio lentus TaxID=136468 RepID=UPI000C8254D0|nr:recombinase family protein [Vibrio lentus]PMJ61312.1 hypothetical protein BCU18_05950 [Vibrio lentus]PMM59925.1 hypothetical protein BCT51_02005 [Vibrio lentus]
MKVAYCRVSTKEQSLESQMAAIHSTFGDDVRIVGEHGVSGKTPAREREAFSKLIDDTMGLRKGDTLIVWWFDRIGRDYHDAKEVAQELLKRGVAIKTVNQSQTFKYIEGDTMHNMTVDMMLTMLAGMAENERQARLASAQAGRDKLSQDEWKEKFQGRKTDTELHDKIIDELSQPKPLSLRRIAVKLGCGVSTVQRVKKSIEA